MKKIKKINYSQYKVRKFTPTLYSESYGVLGCGACALSTLTGLSPLAFISPDKVNPNNWPDYYMVRQLKKRYWKVLELKPLEVSNVDYIEDNITKNHIVLLSQHYTKTDASWSIIYSSLIYHNFAISRLNEYEFLSRPIISSFLVAHPSLI